MLMLLKMLGMMKNQAGAKDAIPALTRLLGMTTRRFVVMPLTHSADGTSCQGCHHGTAAG